MRRTDAVEMDPKDQNRIKWFQIVDIPATQPAVSQKIMLVVKDDDGLNGYYYDIVGSIELKLDDIYAGKYDDYTFLDIYGSPENKQNGIYDLVNYNAEIGSK